MLIAAPTFSHQIVVIGVEDMSCSFFFFYSNCTECARGNGSLIKCIIIWNFDTAGFHILVCVVPTWSMHRDASPVQQ